MLHRMRSTICGELKNIYHLINNKRYILILIKVLTIIGVLVTDLLIIATNSITQSASAFGNVHAALFRSAEF
jgi:hypothetical protein